LLNLYFSGIVFPNPFLKTNTLKQKIQGWSYIIFYSLLVISLITGFFIVNGPKEYKDLLETVHVQSIYYVVLFIIMHISGLVLSEFSNEKGIVSKMIHG
jgi:cytochrome b561